MLGRCRILGGKAAALSLALLFAAPLGLAFTAAAPTAAEAKNAPHATLPAFRSDQELLAFLKKLQKGRARAAQAMPAPPSPAPAMADGAVAQSSAPAEAVTVTGSRLTGADESITNTQEQGVDEGDIVKMRGDTLVILRRGRLFTVSTRDGDLRPIDSIDAFPPGVDPSNDWYDEMLVAGDRVIVIGYSYGRGGTEINRFHLDRDGRLSFDDAYHLRSNDYYSSRNYASRLIGTRLIVYSPLYLPTGDNPFAAFPALQRWTPANARDPQGGFERIVSARQIYMPEPWWDRDDVSVDAMHTVTNCDLTAPVLRCNAMSVLGPAGRTFYVSPHAVYVWVTQYSWGRAEGRKPASMLYRLPLDGQAPSAVSVHGAPTDQFSFREDWNDGTLNVLVRSEGQGDAMWRAEFSDGAVALLRLPLWRFGDGGDDAARNSYQPLPKPGGGGYAFENRFVGDYVLYGAGTSWGRPEGGRASLTAVKVRGGNVTQLPLGHGIDRIEAMGRDAVVIGADERDLHFQAVELTAGARPVKGDRYTLTFASQGETRSHAFFFKPEPVLTVGDTGEGDASAGVLALPVARPARAGYRQLFENSAAMIFLRRANRNFAKLGEIAANDAGAVDDGCRASCVDWYGNARPIFLARRTFALMGYELVEGELGASSIRETRRVNFAPGGRYRGQ